MEKQWGPDKEMVSTSQVRREPQRFLKSKGKEELKEEKINRAKVASETKSEEA